MTVQLTTPATRSRRLLWLALDAAYVWVADSGAQEVLRFAR